MVIASVLLALATWPVMQLAAQQRDITALQRELQQGWADIEVHERILRAQGLKPQVTLAHYRSLGFGGVIITPEEPRRDALLNTYYDRGIMLLNLQRTSFRELIQ